MFDDLVLFPPQELVVLTRQAIADATDYDTRRVVAACGSGIPRTRHTLNARARPTLLRRLFLLFESFLSMSEFRSPWSGMPENVIVGG